MAIMEHTLGILLHPDSEWKAIRNERHSFLQVFLSHVPLLALGPCIANYYAATQTSFIFGDGRLTVDSAAQLSVLLYVGILLSIYVFGEFINWMAHTYGVKDEGAKRHYEGTALAVYASVPVLIAGTIGGFSPDLWLSGVCMILGVAYCVYLIYEGIPILMNIPKEQAFMYASSVVTIGLVLMVTMRVGSVIVWSMGVGPVYTD